MLAGGGRPRSPPRSRALLDGGRCTDATASTQPLTLDDILVVAPYNAQVRCLRERLPDGARVGTVDKFQGQEAPVVFFSMTSSSGEDVPRGMDFLFSRNRLNVAVSRAQALAVVVCSPRLLWARCNTVEQMRLVNALCRSPRRRSGRLRCVLFHHAQGLTDGVRAFADALEGHTVHTPDLYEGNTFADLADGLAYLQTVGFAEIVRRGAAAAVERRGLHRDVAGRHAGTAPRPEPGRARGAVCCTAFVRRWTRCPAQAHMMEGDAEVAEDLDAARGWEGGELFVYPGSVHLFTDARLPDYDEQAAALVTGARARVPRPRATRRPRAGRRGR